MDSSFKFFSPHNASVLQIYDPRFITQTLIYTYFWPEFITGRTKNAIDLWSLCWHKVIEETKSLFSNDHDSLFIIALSNWAIKQVNMWTKGSNSKYFKQLLNSTTLMSFRVHFVHDTSLIFVDINIRKRSEYLFQEYLKLWPMILQYNISLDILLQKHLVLWINSTIKSILNEINIQ